MALRGVEKSAEAVVVKRAGESRKERRAEEPRDRPNDKLGEHAKGKTEIGMENPEE